MLCFAASYPVACGKIFVVRNTSDRFNPAFFTAETHSLSFPYTAAESIYEINVSNWSVTRNERGGKASYMAEASFQSFLGDVLSDCAWPNIISTASYCTTMFSDIHLVKLENNVNFSSGGKLG